MLSINRPLTKDEARRIKERWARAMEGPHVIVLSRPPGKWLMVLRRLRVWLRHLWR